MAEKKENAIPFSYYQQFLTTVETATRQGLESFQKAAQQARRAAYETKE